MPDAQPTLFDPTESDRRKTRGIETVLQNERNDWRNLAYHELVGVARRLPEFTADDVRAAIDRANLGDPHHPNVFGALMKRAQLEGVAEITDRTKMSERKDAHRHRNPVWRSRVHLPC